MTAAPRVVCACDWLVKYTAGLTRGLVDAGAHAVLLSRDHDLEFGGEPGALRSHVRGVLGPDATHLVLPGRPRELGPYREAVRLRRSLRRFAPDVVHLQSTVVNDPRLPLVAGARRGRYALTVHDVTRHPGDPVASGLRGRLEERLVRGAAVSFVHAERLVEDLRRRYGPVPAAVVPMGVDPPSPTPLPEREVLLFFGRLSTYKGLDVLLAALPRLWERRPGVEVHVAGEGPLPDSPALADPRVHVRAEHIPEAAVEPVFAAATLVVLPYREASQSAVGAQAKRFGRGMVVSDVGGLPELVADGSGVVVPAEDPAALADGLADVLEGPGWAERLAAAAAAGVTDSDWRRVGELTLAAYADFGLLDGGRGAPVRTASNTSE